MIDDTGALRTGLTMREGNVKETEVHLFAAAGFATLPSMALAFSDSLLRALVLAIESYAMSPSNISVIYIRTGKTIYLVGASLSNVLTPLSI